MNQRGFTLNELLITAVIMGIIATQAIPAYRRMLQKSRKGEAPVLLASIVTAEAIFFSEYNTYGNNIARMGVQSETIRSLYATGFPSTTSCGQMNSGSIAAPGNASIATRYSQWNLPEVAGNDPVVGPGTASSLIGKQSPFVSIEQARTLCLLPNHVDISTHPKLLTTTAAANGITPTGNGFIATATANIAQPDSTDCPTTGDITTCDTWAIDHSRMIVNIHNGVK